ncbi:cytochrome P-450 cyp509A1 [Hesseltinella vesiculosa]|uniref:Cytochrome P-450 cyp509A1 n=1 Tax=Hesseltinella vesiculosa TaxID=101127 RepID=A0A1X2GK80_9FUNG|nr:cytochrome P-450 cyp509A1 [Hesseltinella vesiculosa]
MVSSQLIEFVGDYVDINYWKDIVLSLTERMTDTKAKRWTLGASVALICVGDLLYTISRPPKHMRHLPYVGFFPVFYHTIVKRRTNRDVYKILYEPMVRKHKLHARFDRAAWTVMVTDPALATQVLVKSGDRGAPKQDFSQENRNTLLFKMFGGSNILFDSGDNWRRHRRLANPAFHKSLPVAKFGQTVSDMFSLLDNDHDRSFSLNVENLIERWTLDIIGHVGFGFNFHAVADERSKYKVIYDKALDDAFNPLYLVFQILDTKLLALNPPRQRSFKNAQDFIDLIVQFVDERRQQVQKSIDGSIADTEKDLLTLMLEAEMRGEGSLTKEELVSDIIIFFVAGHDTSAASLSACLYFLAKHPEIQQKARDEANRILCPDGNASKDALPTLADIKSMVYITQVIKETLRIHPPVFNLVSNRCLKEDLVLDGYPLEKETFVNVGILEMHHHPDFWDMPEEFNPDRFAPDRPDAHNPAWMPFSDGTRQCIGLNLAMTEQVVLLSMLLRKYKVELPDNSIHRDQLIHLNTQLMRPKELDLNFTRLY